jgi:hypothetical protein
MRRLANALAFATLVACGADSTGPRIEALEGSYSLKTVNGQPLPVTLQGDGFTIKLTSDVMTFAANGTWTEAFVFQRTVGTTTTDETESDAGSWTRIGNTISLQSPEIGAFQGTLLNGSLTFNDPGFVQVYSK